jgi:two-component sensor histidine kinase
MDWSMDLTPAEWREAEARVLAELVATGKPVRFRKAYRRKDGSIVPVELKTEVVFGPDGGPGYFFSFVEDISARLASQVALEASLKEKEILYLELQHRVKNSLALVSSVVSLEEMASEEAAVRDSLRNVRGRIEVLSSLYQLLGHDVRTEVDLSRYLGLICESLQSTYGRPGIILDAGLEPLVIDLKRATNLGLILNELVTNSFKYAFPGERAGKVEVRLRREGGLAVLSVGDDGQGLPPGFDPQSSKGLGFQLVQELARQLSARLEGGGSLHVLSLPLGEP